jgi:nucleoside-diphosphate-sugar epimerase
MTDGFWNKRRVLVTGGSGFIGSHVVEMLVERGATVTATVYGRDDLPNLEGLLDRTAVLAADLTQLDACQRACEGQDVVMNIAHADGSVAFKRAKPAFIFRQNMLVTLNMLEAARDAGVGRFFVMSSAEVYSPDAASPIAESHSFGGLEDRPLDGYAWSKRMSEFAGRLFAAEHDMNVTVARPNNVYGPRDYFDAARGRVIPSLIRGAFEGNGPIVLWGDGRQTRTFLFVEDLARGLLALVERGPKCSAVNFSGSEEIAVADLAALIVRLSGREVEIVCDRTKPSGPERRTLATEKAADLLGFEPTVSLEAGLRLTIDAYLRHAAPAIA